MADNLTFSLHEMANTDAIASMDDDAFRDYWEALGIVVRLICRALSSKDKDHG